MFDKIFISPHIKRACYKCPDRKVGCHSSCEKWEREELEHQQKNMEYRKERELTNSINEMADKNRGRFI